MFPGFRAIMDYDNGLIIISPTVFDLKREIESGVKANRSKLMNYIAAGDSIPQNVWLTYFMIE